MTLAVDLVKVIVGKMLPLYWKWAKVKLILKEMTSSRSSESDSKISEYIYIDFFWYLNQYQDKKCQDVDRKCFEGSS